MPAISHSAGSILQRSEDMVDTNPDVFVFDPANTAIVSGRQKPTQIAWLELLWAATLILLLLIFVGLFLHGLSRLLPIQQLNQSGAVVEGRVLSHRIQRGGSLNQSILYFITYQYMPPGETTARTKEEFVDQRVYERFDVGKPLPIKHLPNDPSIAMIVEGTRAPPLEVSIIIETVLGVAGGLIILIYFIPTYKRFWDEERLRWKGHLITGQVLHCHHVTPSEKEQFDGDHFWIELAYRFKTPQGKEIRGTEKRQRNDLNHARLPDFGVPVAIWYLDPQHYHLL